jgi:hypothetical protein
VLYFVVQLQQRTSFVKVEQHGQLKARPSRRHVADAAEQRRHRVNSQPSPPSSILFYIGSLIACEFFV